MECLSLEFINSHWYNTHKPFQERLADAQWLAAFCEKWQLPHVDASEETVSALLDLRAFLSQAATEICLTGTLPEAHLEMLNAYLHTAEAYPSLNRSGPSGFRLDTASPSDGVRAAIHRIALSFARLLAEHSPLHLKQCGNPECGWIFYDDTKGHTKKWCDKTCASLMKVRKHRARLKAQE